MMKLSVTVVKIAGTPIGSVIAPEDLEIGIAVHPRGVEQILRDLREEAFEDVDGHREVGRDIDEDEAGQRVVEAVVDAGSGTATRISSCGGRIMPERMTKRTRRLPRKR